MGPLWIAAVFAIFVLVLAVGYERDMSRKEKNTLIRIEVAALVAILISAYFKSDLGLMLIGTVIFSLLAHYYKTDKQYILGAAGLLYIFVASNVIAPQFIAAALLLGLMSQLEIKIPDKKGTNAVTEIKRDKFQILIGVLLILIYWFLPLGTATLVLAGSIVIGYMLAGMAASSKANGGVLGFLRGMERKGTMVGMGAIWIALGSLIAASVLGTAALIIPVIATIFIADACATIVGLKMKNGHKLPYNDEKSMEGTAAYFIVALIAFTAFGFGWLGLGIALIAAFAESLPIVLDDNFYVPIIICAILLAMA